MNKLNKSNRELRTYFVSRFPGLGDAGLTEVVHKFLGRNYNLSKLSNPDCEKLRIFLENFQEKALTDWLYDSCLAEDGSDFVRWAKTGDLGLGM